MKNIRDRLADAIQFLGKRHNLAREALEEIQSLDRILAEQDAKIAMQRQDLAEALAARDQWKARAQESALQVIRLVAEATS